MREDGISTLIQDGATINELIAKIVTMGVDPQSKVRFLPETWGDGKAQLRLTQKRDAIVYIEICDV